MTLGLARLIPVTWAILSLGETALQQGGTAGR